ncbi:MAG: sensor histidine kinase, partial [Nitrospiria bacterium]
KTEERMAEKAIERAYGELKEAQAQLVHSEKMASIGQLAAGVAHEINNPVGFVSSNLRRLKEYSNDLFQLLRGYELLLAASEKGDTAVVASEGNRVRAMADQMQAEFIMKDLPVLLGESIEGLDRVRRIVLDLKGFSHVDQAERKASDLNRGLESTLKIVWNELKYKADVIKEFGEIPEILCYPQQLNQVFMNLLVNAAQSIEQGAEPGTVAPPGVSLGVSQRAASSVGKGEAPSGLAGGGGTVAPPMMNKGKVWVRTYLQDGHIVVEVEDTGNGISSEHLNKIFDPFFTTKPVGKGSGLGLSISYGIIKKHGGRIEVESKVGKGTKIQVLLPYQEP